MPTHLALMALSNQSRMHDDIFIAVRVLQSKFATSDAAA